MRTLTAIAAACLSLPCGECPAEHYRLFVRGLDEDEAAEVPDGLAMVEDSEVFVAAEEDDRLLRFRHAFACWRRQTSCRFRLLPARTRLLAPAREFCWLVVWPKRRQPPFL